MNSFIPKEVSNLKAGMLEMVTEIHKRAVMLAPTDTGALVNSGRIKTIPMGYAVTFGSSRVPYARRRHFENKKNPQTLEYLEKAGDSVVKGNTSKYFRGRA
jgi:hypothetical protein